MGDLSQRRRFVEGANVIHLSKEASVEESGGDLGDPSQVSPAEGRIVVISARVLQRECLIGGLINYNSDLNILAVASSDEFRQIPQPAYVRAILMIVDGSRVTDRDVREQLTKLVSEAGTAPVIVVADSDEPSEILAAIDIGARGYVTTSVNVSVVAEAIRLACAGGTFVPASSVVSMREAIVARSGAPSLSGIFTPRETRVAEALRKGKANKIIAYELNLCESTVKVHIRSIMRKLKATNRTEVAYRLTETLGLA